MLKFDIRLTITVLIIVRMQSELQLFYDSYWSIGDFDHLKLRLLWSVINTCLLQHLSFISRLFSLH